MNEREELDAMTAILVQHQRQSTQHCLCGYGELGQSHPKHVATALYAAGFGKRGAGDE